MMQTTSLLPTILFWLLAIGLVLLPLLPAFSEWRSPTDVDPLPVVREHDGEARAFALRFADWLHTDARQAMQAAEARGDNRQTLMKGDHAFRLLGEPESWWPQQRHKAIHEGLLSSSELSVPDDAVCPWEVASLSHLKLGRRVQVRAAVAGADLTVGHDARVGRWADATRTLRVLTGARLDGRCTAGTQIFLADDVSFSRLSAPTIKVAAEVEEGEGQARQDITHQDWQPSRGEAIDDEGHTWRLSGNLTLPPRARVTVSLVVDGDLHIGQGAWLQAPLKVKGRLTTDADVRFDGAVVSQGAMALGARCDVVGPVVGESQVLLGRAVHVGSLEALTTVTAQEVTLSEAVCIHGSVWAREAGRVRRA